MYKALIIGLALVFIGGAGFYFKEAGVGDLVTRDITSGGSDGKAYGVTAVDVFWGTYECTEKSGCKNPTYLILAQDTTLDITTKVEGQDVSLGQGTWGVGSGGALVFIFRPIDGAGQASQPKSLIAKKVSSLRIAGFSTKTPLFEGIDNPIFTRIPVSDPRTAQGDN